MTVTWPLHPWVAERRDRITFALQVFPNETPPADRSRLVLPAGRLAETLGFDAFFVSDHPSWGPECWVHLAATTDRIRLGVDVCCALYHHAVMTARAEDEVHLRAKVGRYIPEGPEQRFSGEWAGFGFVGTPEQAVAYYRTLAEAGIQYFLAPVLDAGDEEIVRLLAAEVVPVVRA